MSNRHERRKAAKLSISTMSVSDFLKLPSGSAWAGFNAYKAAQGEAE